MGSGTCSQVAKSKFPKSKSLSYSNNNCTVKLTCENGKSTTFDTKKNKEIDYKWCEKSASSDPKPICSPSAAGEYQCKKAISSALDLGKPFAKDGWKLCHDACVEDTACKAWTYFPQSKQCQKKRAVGTYTTNEKAISGTRAAVATTTRPPTSTSPPSSSIVPTPTPTPGPSQDDWWNKASPFGISWGIFTAIAVVLVLMCFSFVVLILVSSSSSSD